MNLHMLLLAIVLYGKELKCPSIAEQVNKLWYIHNNAILFSNKKGTNC